MINTKKISISKISQAYDLRSVFYDKIIGKSEFAYHLKALDRVIWKPGMRILEVATGPGRVLTEMARRSDDDSSLHGLDISQKMLSLTRKRLINKGIKKYELQTGDCRQLPWPNDYFDLLYNGYMMDLIPFEDMTEIIDEFSRVLKPGGQLILLNMSKKDEEVSMMEWLYILSPKFLSLHLMGNCRPVQMKGHVIAAGFNSVEREYLSGRHPSEIVTAIKEAR